MLDFTSSCYLGIDHSSRNLEPWSQLTTGQPAALFEPKVYRRRANQISALQGMEAGAIAKSTLHLFWDLFGLLGQENFAAFVDAGAYPIAQWGLERFSGLGNDVIKFRHHNPAHLSKALKSQIEMGQRPLIVTDGWCTHCGELAPLSAYIDCARAYDGLLIVDDTQALGLFGHNPCPEQPYGFGGGGSLPHLSMGGPDIIVVSSLAKAFGVPVAILSSRHEFVRRF